MFPEMSRDENEIEFKRIQASIESLGDLFCMEKVQELASIWKKSGTDRQVLARQKHSITLAHIRADLDLVTAPSRTRIKHILRSLDFRVLKMIDWHVIVCLREKLHCDKETGAYSSTISSVSRSRTGLERIRIDHGGTNKDVGTS